MSRLKVFSLGIIGLAIFPTFLSVGYMAKSVNINSGLVADLPGDKNLAKQQILNLTGYLIKNPKDGESWKRLALLYRETGFLKEAVSAYISASQVLPNDVEIRSALFELKTQATLLGKH